MATINTARIAALPDAYFADKRFTRQDLADALRALAVELESPQVVAAVTAPVPGALCMAKGVGLERYCQKPLGHLDRHSYKPLPKVHVAPQRGWEKIEAYTIPSANAQRTYTIKVGNLVKVTKTGKKTATNPQGATTDGWRVVSIERHPQTEKINVEVRKGRGTPSRTFSSDRIVYQRKQGGSS